MLAVDSVNQELGQYYTVVATPNTWEIHHQTKLVDSESFLTVVMKGLGREMYRHIHYVCLPDGRQKTVLSHHSDLSLSETMGCIKAFQGCIEASVFSVVDVRDEKEKYICKSYAQCESFIKHKRNKNCWFYLKIEWSV